MGFDFHTYVVIPRWWLQANHQQAGAVRVLGGHQRHSDSFIDLLAQCQSQLLGSTTQESNQQSRVIRLEESSRSTGQVHRGAIEEWTSLRFLRAQELGATDAPTPLFASERWSESSARCVRGTPADFMVQLEADPFTELALLGYADVWADHDRLACPIAGIVHQSGVQSPANGRAVTNPMARDMARLGPPLVLRRSLIQSISVQDLGVLALLLDRSRSTSAPMGQSSSRAADSIIPPVTVFLDELIPELAEFKESDLQAQDELRQLGERLRRLRALGDTLVKEQFIHSLVASETRLAIGPLAHVDNGPDQLRVSCQMNSEMAYGAAHAFEQAVGQAFARRYIQDLKGSTTTEALALGLLAVPDHVIPVVSVPDGAHRLAHGVAVYVRLWQAATVPESGGLISDDARKTPFYAAVLASRDLGISASFAAFCQLALSDSAAFVQLVAELLQTPLTSSSSSSALVPASPTPVADVPAKRPVNVQQSRMPRGLGLAPQAPLTILKHDGRMREAAREELAAMQRLNASQFQELKKNYLNSLSDSSRKVVLDLQKHMQPNDFAAHLNDHLVRFMLENPASWTHARNH